MVDPQILLLATAIQKDNCPVCLQFQPYLLRWNYWRCKMNQRDNSKYLWTVHKTARTEFHKNYSENMLIDKQKPSQQRKLAKGSTVEPDLKRYLIHNSNLPTMLIEWRSSISNHIIWAKYLVICKVNFCVDNRIILQSKIVVRKAPIHSNLASLLTLSSKLWRFL